MVRWLQTLGWLALVVMCISVVRTTAAVGQDFEVFWRAAQHLLAGEPLYSVQRDGAMPFKYPPWIAPFFLPFGFLSLAQAKWVWGGVEALSLCYTVFWVWRRLGLRVTSVLLAAVLFWGTWIVHALDGQIALPMVALSLLWGGRGSERFSRLFLVLSAKILTLFPLSFQVRRWLSVKSAVVLFFLLAGLTMPALRGVPDHSILTLTKDWIEAAGSTGKSMGGDAVRGNRNPGLVAVVLRLADVPAEDSRWDFALSVLMMGAAAWLWIRVRPARINPEKEWIALLALTPVLHPLPWFHLFSFAFPLAALALDHALARGTPRERVLAALGFLFLCLGSEKLLGKVGAFLELSAGKSGGVLLLLSVVILAEKRS